MPRVAAPKAYHTFVKGLMTEASPINHPDDYASDLDNMVLSRDGSIQRRSGMDYEASAVMSANILTNIFEDEAIIEIPWPGAGNNPLNNFLIQQIGATLYIHDANDSPLGVHKTTVDLNSFDTGLTSTLGINPVQGAAGKGVMFIVGHDIDPFYIEYDEDADTFSTSDALEIKVRDLDGLYINEWNITAEIPYTTAPTWYTGSDWDDDKKRHLYNLYNQGWWDTHLNTYTSSNWFLNDIAPSNSIWILGKDSSDNFSKALLDKQDFGNSPAPRGHFILNDFSRDRRFSTIDPLDDKVGTISGIIDWDFDNPVVSDESRPQAVAFYAGRVFYSGQQSKMDVTTEPDNSGKIYFSPIMTEVNEEFAGRCHQLYDPTSEHLADLLPSDGGVVQIAGIGRIHKMLEMNQSLIILSDAGVWTITGGTDVGFTASAYIIDQISSIGSVNSESVVQAKEGIFYWAANGIHMIQLDGGTGTFAVTDISESTIQDHYSDIGSVARTYSKGIYDPINKTVRWLYNDESTYDGVSYRYKYNRELILDLRLGAFYPYTLGELASDSPYVSGFFPVPGLISSSQAFDVYVGTDLVEVGVDAVQVLLEAAISAPAGIKYTCVEPQSGGTNSQYTYGLYRDPDFVDWVTNDSTGVDAPAYIETGHDIDEDMVATKMAPYLVAYMKRTEVQYIDDGSGNVVLDNPSSCLMQAKWDFADHLDSGKYSTQREIYRLVRLKMPSGSTPQNINYGHEVIVTKNRLRGSGKALKVRFDTTAGSDLYLFGWAIMFTGNTRV